MRLTQHTDYSLRVLLYLASKPEELVQTQEISDTFKLSHNHMTKVVNNLGRKGYLEIRRGRNGGILLSKPPAEINIGDVIKDTEPDFYMVECFNNERLECPLIPVCSYKGVLNEAMDAFLKVLDQYTLEDVLNKPGANVYAKLLS